MKLAYSVTEACEATSLSRAYLYKLMDRGELAFTKLGRRRLIPTHALDTLVDDRESRYEDELAKLNARYGVT